MKYTAEEKQRIKQAFTKKDREKMKAYFQDARQIYNGLRRVSPDRAAEIAVLIGRKSIVRVLLPKLFRSA